MAENTDFYRQNLLVKITLADSVSWSEMIIKTNS